MAKHLGVEPANLERMRKAMVSVERFSGRDAAPCAPYELQNNNANIRRIKERIAELEKEGRVMETTEVDHGFCTIAGAGFIPAPTLSYTLSMHLSSA